MEIFNEVVNYFNSVPASTWHALGAFLGGSTAIAALLQIIKHKFNITEAKKLLAFLLGFISFLASFADFLLQQNATHPLPTIGKLTIELIGAATLIHRFAVSPAYYKLAAKLANLQAWLDKVAAYEAGQKPAVAAPVAPTAASALPDEANLAQFQVQG
jgi:hypothetical protein